MRAIAIETDAYRKLRADVWNPLEQVRNAEDDIGGYHAERYGNQYGPTNIENPRDNGRNDDSACNLQ